MQLVSYFCCVAMFGKSVADDVKIRFDDTTVSDHASARRAYYEGKGALRKLKRSLGVLHALTSSLEREIGALQA